MIHQPKPPFSQETLDAAIIEIIGQKTFGAYRYANNISSTAMETAMLEAFRTNRKDRSTSIVRVMDAYYRLVLAPETDHKQMKENYDRVVQDEADLFLSDDPN